MATASRIRGIPATGLPLREKTSALITMSNNELEENSVDFTPESGTITMFSTTWCGYCNRLKKQLDAQGIGYTEINIEEVEGTADLVEQLNGGNRTVPTVLFPDGTAATNPSAAEVKSRLAA
jgi:mycoredoxin